MDIKQIDQQIREQINKEKSISIFVSKYALRSFKQVLIHAFIAIVLAILFHLLASNIIKISGNDFVPIMSSLAAACGALLAVSIAFYTFMGRYMTDWRDRVYERFRQEREELKSQIKMSAKHHSEISRRLVNLYYLAATYQLGQVIDKDKVYEADKVFHDWTKDYASQTKRKFDFGDLDTYDSFEKHLFDAHLCSTAVRQSLIDLHVAEISGRPLTTFSPLVTTWVVILIFSLVSAIIGGTGIIYETFNISILIVPTYLLPFAILALILDFTAFMSTMRIHEIGYEKGVLELMEKSHSTPKT